MGRFRPKVVSFLVCTNPYLEAIVIGSPALDFKKQHTLLWADVTSLLNIQKGEISNFCINHLKSRGGRVDRICQICLFGGHYLVIRV